MAAHIGRIIVPFQDRGSTANFSRASEFPQENQNDERHRIPRNGII